MVKRRLVVTQQRIILTTAPGEPTARRMSITLQRPRPTCSILPRPVMDPLRRQLRSLQQPTQVRLQQRQLSSIQTRLLLLMLL
jgi:hypothetical protein